MSDQSQQTTEQPEHVPVLLVAYESDADLELNDEGQVLNHDELVDNGQTYDKIRMLKRETVEEHGVGSRVTRGSPFWCDEVAEMEPGDALRVDEIGGVWE